MYGLRDMLNLTKLVSKYFKVKFKLSLPILHELIMILPVFNFLFQFFMLDTYWLVKSYNFTSQLVILTTMVDLVYNDYDSSEKILHGDGGATLVIQKSILVLKSDQGED